MYFDRHLGNCGRPDRGKFPGRYRCCTLRAGFIRSILWLACLALENQIPSKKGQGEQAAMAANKVKESNDAYKGLSKALKWRVWKYRIAGALIAVLGVSDVVHGELEYLLDILRNSRADYRYCNLYDGFTAGL